MPGTHRARRAPDEWPRNWFVEATDGASCLAASRQLRLRVFGDKAAAYETARAALGGSVEDVARGDELDRQLRTACEADAARLGGQPKPLWTSSFGTMTGPMTVIATHYAVVDDGTCILPDEDGETSVAFGMLVAKGWSTATVDPLRCRIRDLVQFRAPHGNVRRKGTGLHDCDYGLPVHGPAMRDRCTESAWTEYVAHAQTPGTLLLPIGEVSAIFLFAVFAEAASVLGTELIEATMERQLPASAQYPSLRGQIVRQLRMWTVLSDGSPCAELRINEHFTIGSFAAGRDGTLQGHGLSLDCDIAEVSCKLGIVIPPVARTLFSAATAPARCDDPAIGPTLDADGYGNGSHTLFARLTRLRREEAALLEGDGTARPYGADELGPLEIEMRCRRPSLWPEKVGAGSVLAHALGIFATRRTRTQAVESCAGAPESPLPPVLP